MFIQTRFKEEHEVEKPKRNLAKHQIHVPPSVKTSISPGPWLTNIIDECYGLDGCNLTEAQESAFEIANAYRLVPRYRVLRYPVPSNPHSDVPATEFIVDEVETLETRSLCFGEGVKEPKDESDPFKYMDQPNVLSGREGEYNLVEWLRTHSSAVSLSRSKDDLKADKKADRKERKKILGKPKQVKTSAPKVTDADLSAQYARWVADPTPENQTTLFDVLTRFIAKKVRSIAHGDTVRKRGLDEDHGQDFVIAMIEKLIVWQQRGKVIEKPAHYVARAFRLGTWKRNKAIAEYDRRHPSVFVRGVDADADDDAGVDLLDQSSHEVWSRGHPSNADVADESEEEFLQRCMAKRETLEEDLRDISDLWVAGCTAQKIADALKLSRQQVERRKTKIKKATQNRKVA